MQEVVSSLGVRHYQADPAMMVSFRETSLKRGFGPLAQATAEQLGGTLPETVTPENTGGYIVDYAVGGIVAEAQKAGKDPLAVLASFKQKSAQGGPYDTTTLAGGVRQVRILLDQDPRTTQARFTMDGLVRSVPTASIRPTLLGERKPEGNTIILKTFAQVDGYLQAFAGASKQIPEWFGPVREEVAKLATNPGRPIAWTGDTQRSLANADLPAVREEAAMWAEYRQTAEAAGVNFDTLTLSVAEMRKAVDMGQYLGGVALLGIPPPRN